MKTLIDNLREFVADINASITQLIQTHSEIYRWNPSGSGLVTLDGDYAWQPLSLEGKRLQSKVWRDYSDFHALLTTLLQDQPKKYFKKLDEYHTVVTEIIQQNASMPDSDKNAELKQTARALEELLTLVCNIFESGDDGPLLVPDTNVLLHAPNPDTWEFDPFSTFTVVLTPTVLYELDARSCNYPNETLRLNATRLIDRIKGYRKNGRLSAGVPITPGIRMLRSFASEPAMETSLPWLQATSCSDRFLASVFEIIRENLCPDTFIVTRDLSLQTKAEFARLPFIEPPDPTE